MKQLVFTLAKLTPLLRLLRRADALLRRWRRGVLPAELVAFEDVTAAWLASALGTAVQLELPDKVPLQGGTSLSALSRETGVSPQELERLLLVVQSHGYFSLSQGEVRHTKLSRSLKLGSAGAFCRLQSSAWYRDCFCPERVTESLRCAQTPFDHKAQQRFFETFSGAPERADLFSQAMAEITRFCGPHLVEHLEFVQGERVLDVGGGDGTLAKLLADSHPGAEFCTLDLAESAESGRIKGDFFQAIPSDFGHLILKNVLHDWDDGQSLKILENCHESGAQKLTIVELVLPEAEDCSLKGAADYLVDWNVFCTLGGQERSLQDYRRLLERTGWCLVSAKPTTVPLWVLEARRQ